MPLAVPLVSRQFRHLRHKLHEIVRLSDDEGTFLRCYLSTSQWRVSSLIQSTANNVFIARSAAEHIMQRATLVQTTAEQLLASVIFRAWRYTRHVYYIPERTREEVELSTRLWLCSEGHDPKRWHEWCADDYEVLPNGPAWTAKDAAL